MFKLVILLASAFHLSISACQEMVENQESMKEELEKLSEQAAAVLG